jgi:hypothetical protein
MYTLLVASFDHGDAQRMNVAHVIGLNLRRGLGFRRQLKKRVDVD